MKKRLKQISAFSPPQKKCYIMEPHVFTVEHPQLLFLLLLLLLLLLLKNVQILDK